MDEPRILPVPIPPKVVSVTGPGSITLNTGGSVTVPFTAERINTGTALSLSVGSLPTGVTASLSPTSLPVSPQESSSAAFSLTLTAAADAPLVQTTIEVTATGSGVTADLPTRVPLLVQAVGTVRPSYKVLFVAYAPPGAALGSGGSDSTVQYGSGSTAGAATTISGSFNAGVSVTGSIGLAFGSQGSGTINIGADEVLTASWTSTVSSQVSINTTSTLSRTIPGPPENAIDHGYDRLYLWLNPQLNVTIGPHGVVWEPADTGTTSTIQYVQASWLTNPSTMPAGTAQQLEAAGVTMADYAQILACDPFSQPTPPQLVPPRFLPTAQSMPYEPPTAPGGAVPTTTFTITGQTTTTTTQVAQVQYGCSIDVSAGAALTLSAALKASGSLQWTDSSTSVLTTGSSQSASVTIGGPGYGYSGPTNVLVYWDTIYNTFVFAFGD